MLPVVCEFNDLLHYITLHQGWSMKFSHILKTFFWALV